MPSPVHRWLADRAAAGILGQLCIAILIKLGVWPFIVAIPTGVALAVLAVLEGLPLSIAVLVMLATIAVTLIALHYGVLFFGLYFTRRPRLVLCAMHAPKYRAADIFQQRGIHYKCEIAVHNKGRQAAEGVDVKITKFEPEDAMNVFHPAQTVFPKRQTINVGDYRAWTIAEGEHKKLGESVDLKINVQVHGREYISCIDRVYLTIKASATNASPASRDFVLYHSREGCPLLVPEDELYRAEE